MKCIICSLIHYRPAVSNTDWLYEMFTHYRSFSFTHVWMQSNVWRLVYWVGYRDVVSLDKNIKSEKHMHTDRCSSTSSEIRRCLQPTVFLWASFIFYFWTLQPQLGCFVTVCDAMEVWTFIPISPVQYHLRCRSVDSWLKLWCKVFCVDNAGCLNLTIFRMME